MEKKLVIPYGMMKYVCQALWKKWGYADNVILQKDVIDNEIFAVEAALIWLDDILHPSNADFHKAILEAERIRCPGNDGASSVIARRVDFEYGVSFARNYIHDLFHEPDEDEPIRDLKWSGLGSGWEQTSKKHNEEVAEAYRRGQQSSSQSADSSVIEHFPRRSR